MSGSVNKVILVGRLGKDPELKYTPSGAPVAKFSLATDESFKDRTGEKQNRTEWHNIVAWNKLAEICGEYLTKGKLVYIEGSIRSRQWQDQSGNKRTSYEIIANQMQMLGSKAESERMPAGLWIDRARTPSAPPHRHRLPRSRFHPPNPKSATRIFRSSPAAVIAHYLGPTPEELLINLTNHFLLTQDPCRLKGKFSSRPCLPTGWNIRKIDHHQALQQPMPPRRRPTLPALSLVRKGRGGASPLVPLIDRLYELIKFFLLARGSGSAGCARASPGESLETADQFASANPLLSAALIKNLPDLLGLSVGEIQILFEVRHRPIFVETLVVLKAAGIPQK